MSCLRGAVRGGSGAIAVLLLCLGCNATGEPHSRGPGSVPTRTLQAVPGIWLNAQEIAALPDRGPAWEALLAAAQAHVEPILARLDDTTNRNLVAKALVFAKTHDDAYRQQVIEAIRNIQGTEAGSTALPVSRKLVSLVIAADLVSLPPEDDARFRQWLRLVLQREFEGLTLVATHERRPNNWGTHAGASRAAVARYLGLEPELARCAQVFKGWLGDRATYREFKFGDRSWQANPRAPVGINPKGATKQGHSLDGVLPDDQRRGGKFSWPPPHENYVYEALQGALVQAVILYRAGWDTWSWEDRALLRAFRWLHDVAGFPPEGDDTWQAPLMDHFYGTDFWTGESTRPGKSLGWTDWSHTGR